MNKLEALCVHIITKSENSMTPLRLGYLTYLCDWASALRTKKKISNKEYRYYHNTIENDILDNIEDSLFFNIICVLK